MLVKKLVLSLVVIGMVTSPVWAGRSVLTVTSTVVGTNITQVQATNVSRNFLMLQNDSENADVYCKISAGPLLRQGIRLNSGGGSILLDAQWPTGAVLCVATSVGRVLSIEGTGP